MLKKEVISALPMRIHQRTSFGLLLVTGLLSAAALLWPFGAEVETEQRAEVQRAAFRPFLIGQGVELHAQGVIIGDGEVLLSTGAVRNGAKTSRRLDDFLKTMAASFDALEFRIQTDIETPRPDTTAVANAFIRRAHEFGLEVGLNYWRYPNTLTVPDEFQAKKLDDQGRVIDASLDDDHVKTNHVDKSNPEALIWFSGQVAAGLATVPDFDFFLVVEDKVSSWVQTDAWPQRVRYLDSPTYSAASLESFQAFTILHGLGERFLPVDRTEFVRAGLTEYAAPSSSLWAYWYQWRFGLFNRYLAALGTAVEAVNPDAPLLFMSWQRVIDEAAAVSNDDWRAAGWDVGQGPGTAENAVFGVSVRSIAAERTVDEFILEYGEDGTVWGWPMRLNRVHARDVKAALRNTGIRFGSFVQLYNYSDEQHIIAELVVDELKIGRSYKAKTVVVYDVATLFPKSRRYNQEIALYWRSVYAWNLERFDDLSLITMIRREILKARGRKLGLDPDRPGPPGIPAGVGAWYDRTGTIYISTAALRGREAPYYAVADHWDNPLLVPENWLDEAADRGYVAIRRPDLTRRGFQIVDKFKRWAPIAETAGVCVLKGVICRPGTWLFKPIPWTKIDWTGFGWRP